MVRVESQGRLLRVRVVRAEKRNALNISICKSIVKAISEATAADVGCVLLTAEGPSFCAGMDLAEAGQADAGELAAAHEALFNLNRRAAVPIVAFVQGHALAGGTGLVAQAHVVVAGEDAQFGLTEVKIGMWPLMVYRSVEAAIGPRRTLEWSLTGRIVLASEALTAGLVHELGPASRAEAIAQEIAGRGADAIGTGMRYYRESRGLGMDEAGAVAAKLRQQLMATPGYLQAASRFKR
jgi:enoyl-CoA hydratase/carnithine racemase